MAKTKISEFSATPGNNTDIDGINIAEGCAPSGINDAIRELMAQLKDFQAGTAGDSFNGPVGSTTPAAGAFTTLTASTSATLSGLTVNNGYTEETVSANTGTAYTINLDNGSVQILTLTGNCTFTFPTATAGRSFFLLLKQDGTGGRTVTWPAAVKWPSSTAPTITSTASRTDKFVFTADGTNWVGSLAGQNYTL